MLSTRNAFIFVLYFAKAVSSECEEQSPCVFKLPNGVVDLSNMKPTAGMFTAYLDTNYAFFYHPCNNEVINNKTGVLWRFQPANPLNTTMNGQDVLDGKVNGTFSLLATAVTAKCFSADTYQRTSILYTSEGITSEILLVCDDVPTIMRMRSSQNFNYSLELEGIDACIHKAAPSRHLSGGSVFVIIFFTFSFLYLFFGALVLHFFRGAQGLEMIPNLEFWLELPSLVKDGLKFACCRGRELAVYDQI